MACILLLTCMGINGNKWREEKLASRGFEFKDTVSAANPEGAIALYIEDNQNSPEIEITKRDKMNSYSVADELLKWAKLKEDGLISKEDYEKAKNALLNREENSIKPLI